MCASIEGSYKLAQAFYKRKRNLSSQPARSLHFTDEENQGLEKLKSKFPQLLWHID